MFSRSSNRWQCSVDPGNLMVTFCVWTLKLDGLRVPPFDRHADGNGSLRAAGMEAEGWRAWFHEVVAGEDAQRHGPGFIPEMTMPPARWNGASAVRERLDALWEQFGPISGAERRPPGPEFLAWNQTVLHGLNLWKLLQPFQTRLATLNIFIVRYPAPIEYLVPPVSLILSFAEHLPDAEPFRASVLRGAEALASSAGH